MTTTPAYLRQRAGSFSALADAYEAHANNRANSDAERVGADAVNMMDNIIYKVEIIYHTKRNQVVWCEHIAAPDIDVALDEAHRKVFRRHPRRTFVEAVAMRAANST